MRSLPYVILSGFILLASCNDARKPSDSNFRNVINQYLQNHGQACIWLGQTFPINVSEAQQKLNYGIGTQMSVLERAALVRSIDAVTNIPRIFGGSTQQHVRRYEPTEAGNKYLRQTQAVLSQTSGFCYGTKTVDSIISWTAPATSGPAKQTEITYTYKIDDLAAWAKRPDIQSEFGDVRVTVNNISKTNETVGLQLTNKGWEVPTP
jgi:hypothetical protein